MMRFSLFTPRSLCSTVARPCLLAGVLVAGFSLTLRAQQEAPVMPENVSLKQLMSPEEFRAAGLKKLSPAELERLENFLKGYREQTVQQVTKTTEERVNPAPKRNRATNRAVVEQQIKGHFAGLTGRTRILLSDGSIWQEVNGEVMPVSLDNPDVVLVKTAFGYKMYITGAPHWFYVRQVILD